jgi:hypothetical protein
MLLITFVFKTLHAYLFSVLLCGYLRVELVGQFMLHFLKTPRTVLRFKYQKVMAWYNATQRVAISKNCCGYCF